MTRYLLAAMMLALCAGGVVWIAVREQSAAKRAKPEKPTAVATATTPEPSASTSTSTSANANAVPAADAEIADAAPAAAVDASVDASASASGQRFPALAPYAAWSVVRWGMSVSEVESVLRDGGVVVVEATDTKNAAKRVRAKGGTWDVTIDFGASGPSQIIVTATKLSREAAQAAVAKVKERAPATSTIEHTERHWKKDGGASATLTTDVDGTNATMREEHVRERSPGGWIGFASLRWGMSTQEVVGLLTARGYGARAVKALATGPETVQFSASGVEGVASFNQFGLRHVELSGPTTDAGAARAKELEASLGKPTSVDASTKTRHADHARMTSIDVEVLEKQPANELTVTETYRPKN